MGSTANVPGTGSVNPTKYNSHEMMPKPTVQRRCTKVCHNNCEARGCRCDAASKVAAEAAAEIANRKLRKKISVCYGELDVGSELGTGGFCGVHEVRLQSRTFAMKRLKPETLAKQTKYVNGARDLATEAVLLSNLSHRNIIRVQGMASGSVRTCINSNEGFFLIVDRLESTLDKQMDEWWDEEEAMGWMERKRQRKQRLLKRMEVALDIAKGMNYLHSQNLVHRDLKPANIGFDKDGVVKLFDFGISVRLESSDGRLKEKVGTPRYMAPEMSRRESYGKSVDMYAFGLILWQLCELQKPYMQWNKANLLRQKVAYEGGRPKVARWWPKAIKDLMKECWSQDPWERPDFGVVMNRLEDIVKDA